VLAGAIALAASLRGAAPLTTARDALAARLMTPARVTAFIALVFAVPWAYALVQRGPIAGA